MNKLLFNFMESLSNNKLYYRRDYFMEIFSYYFGGIYLYVITHCCVQVAINFLNKLLRKLEKNPKYCCPRCFTPLLIFFILIIFSESWPILLILSVGGGLVSLIVIGSICYYLKNKKKKKTYAFGINKKNTRYFTVSLFKYTKLNNSTFLSV